ncbi:MAG: hypothetical protein WC329_04545, partial [Candidatus Omnitrophota bacterium]
MSSWRGKLWLKAVALAVAGIFAFSEVTWAARTDFILPPAVAANRNIPSSQENQTPVKKSLFDTFNEIYTNFSSVLFPFAHAEITNTIVNYDAVVASNRIKSDTAYQEKGSDRITENPLEESAGNGDIGQGINRIIDNPVRQDRYQPTVSFEKSAENQPYQEMTAFLYELRKMASTVYQPTADSFYCDLNSLKVRQAVVATLGIPTDCLDRSVYLFRAASGLGLDPEIVLIKDKARNIGHALLTIKDVKTGK